MNGPFCVLLVGLSLCLCDPLTLRVISPKRIDIIVKKNIYPEIYRVDLCDTSVCQPLRNYTVKNHVIRFLNQELKPNETAKIYLNIYSADSSVRNETMITVQLPRRKSGGINILNVYVPWYFVGLAFLAPFVLAGLIMYVVPQKKKSAILSEYVFENKISESD